MDNDGGRGVIVFRCEGCGDTFPLHGADDPVCPTCGSRELHVAGEPLL